MNEATHDPREPGDFTLYATGALGGLTGVAIHEEALGLGVFADEAHAERAILKRMEEEKFWPNVWWLDDHGGLMLLRTCDICGHFTGNPSGEHYECAATSGSLREWERHYG